MFGSGMERWSTLRCVVPRIVESEGLPEAVGTGLIGVRQASRDGPEFWTIARSFLMDPEAWRFF